MEVKTSFCRNCHAQCPILVTVDKGQVLKVEGDPDAPIYDGFICPKARAIPEIHHNPNRLLSSLKRLPDGRHVPISSEQLVDEIAGRLKPIIDQHGPNAVAAYMGGGVMEQMGTSAIVMSFMRSIKTPMVFSAATIDQPGHFMASALHGTWLGGRPHPDKWDTFLMVGGNPIISKQYFLQNPGKQLKAIARAGAKLIVIDPRRSETARRAAVHLQIIPGEDPTVLAGLIHLVIEMRGADAAFVAENAEGLEALREATSDFTPEYVAARAGVDADQLVAAARILIGARSGDMGLGVGPSMATRGTLSSYLVLCLQTLRGFWSREGDAVSRPRVLLPPQTWKAQPAPPQPAWGFGLRTRVRGLQQSAAGMPTAALPDLMLSQGDDRIRALFNHAGIIYTWPDRQRTRKALAALDLFVMHDVELTATSALADYVIATKRQLEMPAISYFAETTGRAHPGYDWNEPYGVYQPAVMDVPPESDLLEGWQIYYRLAQKLGLELDYYDLANPAARPVKLDMINEPTMDDLYELYCEGSAIPLSRVKQYPHGAVFEEARGVVQARDPDCRAKLMIANPNMIKQLREVRQEDVMARRKTCSDYPFLLISSRLQASTNSGVRPSKSSKTSYNPTFMNPGDMEAKGFHVGDMVQISSRHGAVTSFVTPDSHLRPGVIAIMHGFGAKHGQPYNPGRDGANVNDLLSWEDDYDPHHGMPRMSAVPVRIEAAATKRPAS